MGFRLIIAEIPCESRSKYFKMHSNKGIGVQRYSENLNFSNKSQWLVTFHLWLLLWYSVVVNTDGPNCLFLMFVLQENLHHSFFDLFTHPSMHRCTAHLWFWLLCSNICVPGEPGEEWAQGPGPGAGVWWAVGSGGEPGLSHQLSGGRFYEIQQCAGLLQEDLWL